MIFVFQRGKNGPRPRSPPTPYNVIYNIPPLWTTKIIYKENTLFAHKLLGFWQFASRTINFVYISPLNCQSCRLYIPLALIWMEINIFTLYNGYFTPTKISRSKKNCKDNTSFHRPKVLISVQINRRGCKVYKIGSW